MAVDEPAGSRISLHISTSSVFPAAVMISSRAVESELNAVLNGGGVCKNMTLIVTL